MKLPLTLIALLTLGACSDDKKDESKAPTASKAAAAEPLKIEKFGLSIDVPAGTKVSSMGDSQMLQGPDLVVTVDLAGDFSAKTLAEEIENADMYSPLNLTKTEVEGGWDVTFENKGGMGTNYWVKVRRVVGGKSYDCSTTASNTKQQKNALKACQSLK